MWAQHICILTQITAFQSLCKSTSIFNLRKVEEVIISRINFSKLVKHLKMHILWKICIRGQSRILNLPVYVHYLHGDTTHRTNIYLDSWDFWSFCDWRHVMQTLNKQWNSIITKCNHIYMSAQWTIANSNSMWKLLFLARNQKNPWPTSPL